MRALMVLSYGFGIALLALVAFGFWKLERRLHYSFSYEAQVHDQLQREVKAECLK